jgi:hypothetical protein
VVVERVAGGRTAPDSSSEEDGVVSMDVQAAITDAQRNLIWQIDTACRKCIRAVVFFDATTGKTPDLWTFCQNCFAETAVIQWCHIFNNYKDCTHFTRLFDDPLMATIDSAFTVDSIRSRLHAAVCLTADKYAVFRKKMQDFRNLYVAHWDYETKVVEFPDLDMAKDLCIEMREALRELTVRAVPNGSGRDFKNLRDLLTSYDNKQQLRTFRREADHLRKIK